MSEAQKAKIEQTAQAILDARALYPDSSLADLYDENRHHWFADAKMKYKMKRIDLEVEASNLFNLQAYTQVNYSNLNIYRNVCQLRPMNVVAKVRFKLL